MIPTWLARGSSFGTSRRTTAVLVLIPAAVVFADLTLPRLGYMWFEIGHRQGRTQAQEAVVRGELALAVSYLTSEQVGIDHWSGASTARGAGGTGYTLLGSAYRTVLAQTDVRDLRVDYGCISWPTDAGFGYGWNEIAVPAITRRKGPRFFSMLADDTQELLSQWRMSGTSD